MPTFTDDSANLVDTAGKGNHGGRPQLAATSLCLAVASAVALTVMAVNGLDGRLGFLIVPFVLVGPVLAVSAIVTAVRAMPSRGTQEVDAASPVPTRADRGELPPGPAGGRVATVRGAAGLVLGTAVLVTGGVTFKSQLDESGPFRAPRTAEERAVADRVGAFTGALLAGDLTRACAQVAPAARSRFYVIVEDSGLDWGFACRPAPHLRGTPEGSLRSAVGITFGPGEATALVPFFDKGSNGVSFRLVRVRGRGWMIESSGSYGLSGG